MRLFCSYWFGFSLTLFSERAKRPILNKNNSSCWIADLLTPCGFGGWLLFLFVCCLYLLGFFFPISTHIRISGGCISTTNVPEFCIGVVTSSSWIQRKSCVFCLVVTLLHPVIGESSPKLSLDEVRSAWLL